VIDGDTIDAICDNTLQRIRLARIDSYESRKNNRAYRQAYELHIPVEQVVQRGHQATSTIKQVFIQHGVNFNLDYKSHDQYNRIIGEVFFKDSINLSDFLLSQYPSLYLEYK
jgi:endonuclease YncB( thermonuclease family)